jgi:hypothetical protein
MKLIISVLLVLGAVACTSDEVNYSSPHMTYKKHVSQETKPVLPYSRSVGVSKLQ